MSAPLAKSSTVRAPNRRDFLRSALAAGAAAFLEGRTIQPIDRVVEQMMTCSEQGDFEAAVRWRERFEQLEWLFGALNRARAATQLTLDALRGGLSLEFPALDLRIAVNAVGEIVGKTATEDLLEVIFSQFCIGK